MQRYSVFYAFSWRDYDFKVITIYLTNFTGLKNFLLLLLAQRSLFLPPSLFLPSLLPPFFLPLIPFLLFFFSFFLFYFMGHILCHRYCMQSTAVKRINKTHSLSPRGFTVSWRRIRVKIDKNTMWKVARNRVLRKQRGKTSTSDFRLLFLDSWHMSLHFRNQPPSGFGCSVTLTWPRNRRILKWIRTLWKPLLKENFKESSPLSVCPGSPPQPPGRRPLSHSEWCPIWVW